MYPKAHSLPAEGLIHVGVLAETVEHALVPHSYKRVAGIFTFEGPKTEADITSDLKRMSVDLPWFFECCTVYEACDVPDSVSIIPRKKSDK